MKAKEKAKLVDAATSETKEKPLVGDFPPYGGVTVEQWRVEQKRRRERLEKMTPQEQDEQSAERKRQRERWENTTPKSPAE